MEPKILEREEENQKKTRGNTNWAKTKQNQQEKAMKKEPVAEIEPAVDIPNIFNPLGRMENRSGGW